MLLIDTDIRLLNPKGTIAWEQHILFIYIAILLLLIAVSTLLLLYFIAWKYRESNTHATYEPNAPQSKLVVGSMWIIPTLFMFLLVFIMWPATHKLEPRKSIVSDTKPITIQVVALRWKWLFIYPQQNIATVNFVQIPVDTPVQFELTADETPMSSFWIPHLGGQLYAMTGHVNRLNLIASEFGEYPGSSAEINGAGFADMKFVARASNTLDFNEWVEQVRRSSSVLDVSEYKRLLSPSEKNSVMEYSSTDSSLFDALLMKYNSSHGHQTIRQKSEHE